MTGELLLNQSWSRIEMTIDGWIPEIETKGNEMTNPSLRINHERVVPKPMSNRNLRNENEFVPTALGI